MCPGALQAALQGLGETSSIHSDCAGYRGEKTGHKCVEVDLTEKQAFTETTDDAESNLSPDIQKGLSLFLCMSMYVFKFNIPEN